MGGQKWMTGVYSGHFSNLIFETGIWDEPRFDTMVWFDWLVHKPLESSCFH